jgi:hypothetical protein
VYCQIDWSRLVGWLSVISWNPGPPPEADDGSCVLVILKDDYESSEYYGDPIVVCRYSSKLKTTIDPIRIEYDVVAKWADLPENWK